MIDASSTQSVYDTLNAIDDNKKLWAISGYISRELTKAQKQQDELQTIKAAEEEKEHAKGKGEKFEDIMELLNDKQALRVRVMEDLLKGSSKQNAQASDKLAKLAGLDADKQDISIELVQYSETPLECPSCGENLHKPS